MPLVMRVSFTPPKPFSPMANEFGFYFGAKEPLCDPPSLREGHICAIVQKLNNAPFVVPTDVPAQIRRFPAPELETVRHS